MVAIMGNLFKVATSHTKLLIRSYLDCFRSASIVLLVWWGRKSFHLRWIWTAKLAKHILAFNNCINRHMLMFSTPPARPTSMTPAWRPSGRQRSNKIKFRTGVLSSTKRLPSVWSQIPLPWWRQRWLRLLVSCCCTDGSPQQKGESLKTKKMFCLHRYIMVPNESISASACKLATHTVCTSVVHHTSHQKQWCS